MRRPWLAAAAAGVLLLALAGPLERLAEASLAAHMLQHMLLFSVAAPLLVLSRPSLRALRGSRLVGRMLRTGPHTAFALQAAAIWIAHAPAFVAWSSAYIALHVAEHAVLLGSALLFWWALCRRGRAGYGEAALWTLATMIHTGLLGALLTLAPRPLYAGYSLDDQQLAGLAMWVPGGLLYLAAGLVFGYLWISSERPPVGSQSPGT